MFLPKQFVAAQHLGCKKILAFNFIDGSRVEFHFLINVVCANFLSELHSLEWVAIFVARVAVGLLFFLSGRAKLFVPGRREEIAKH